jgi:hypothetical protein
MSRYIRNIKVNEWIALRYQTCINVNLVLKKQASPLDELEGLMV